MIRLVGGVETSAGRVRSQNQDRPLLTEWVAAVADGMGGHKGGETAAQLAVTELAALRGPVGVDDLVAAVRGANERILDRADDPNLRGMGTTLVALALDGDDVVLVNVGDSRGYRLADGELEQLTEDHSLVEDLVRQGQLSAEEARTHPQRNIVTRALGIGGDLPVDVFRTAARVGDRYLLCSDGLVNEVDEERIVTELRLHRDPAVAARELVRLANAAGARDNVTCVVVDLHADGAVGAVDHTDEAVPGEAVDGTEVEARLAVGKATPATGSDRSVWPSVDAGRDRPGSARGDIGRRRVRRRGAGVPWRLVPYVLAVLAIVGVAIGGTLWWGRSAYFVGALDGEVVIFRGRPGGVLWMDPTVAETTGIDYDELTGASRERLVDPPVGSLGQARQVLAGLSTAGSGAGSTASQPPGVPTAPTAVASNEAPGPVTTSTEPVPTTTAGTPP